MSDDFSECKPPMRHIAGVNVDVLRRGGNAPQPAPQGVAEVMELVRRYSGLHFYSGTQDHVIAQRLQIEQAITAIVQERDALRRDRNNGLQIIEVALQEVTNLRARVTELEQKVNGAAEYFKYLQENNATSAAAKNPKT